jgi:hypothetical protein
VHRCEEHNDEVDRAFDALLERCMADYRNMQDALGAELSGHARWHYDFDCCTLAFSGGTMAPRTLPITPIATYLPSVRNWCWAWANDALPPLAREKAVRIKDLARKTQYRVFEIPSVDIACEEIDELCALALHELGGRGVFKVKEDDPWKFMVIDK